jgi:hypothetical protein
VINRSPWGYAPHGDWLTIYCGTDDLEWDGTRWYDKYSGKLFTGLAYQDLAGINDGRWAALTLFPTSDPYAERPVGARHEIILSHKVLVGLPGDVHQTLESLYQTRYIRPGVHIRDTAQFALSIFLLHELFHCAFHSSSKYLSPRRPHCKMLIATYFLQCSSEPRSLNYGTGASRIRVTL